MILIDTHAHFPKSKTRTKDILNRAAEQDVKYCIGIGTDLKENDSIINHALMFEHLYAGIGIYPNSEMAKRPATLTEQLEKQIKRANSGSKKVVIAIGECGIDITEWHNQRPLKEQLELFELQILLAQKLTLPVIIHNRNGDEHILKLLQKYNNQNLQGVVHCFDSTLEFANKILELNFYISFTGFLTFNRKSYLADIVKEIPLNRILIETDSPYI
ncbi:TatD family hydrolase, partial [candidate division WWE3 bacterium]|nr:TatD family hydrolase [candidate division WWE3 bacterium]